MLILVRYGEIGIKSKVIRRELENLLRKNIIKLLKKYDIDCDVNILHGRLLVKINTKGKEEEAKKLLKKVLGIVSYSVVYECPLDIEEIINTAIQLVKKALSEREIKTFAVKTKRSNKNFPYTSMEVNEKVGEEILNKFNLKVDLENPDLTIGIEILKNRVYVFYEIYKGFGGLPVGSQGKVLVLLSDGIDSPVAAFLMMKRGCRVVPLHLKISDEGLDKVRRIVNILSDYDTEMELVVYNYTDELMEIANKLKEIKKENYTCIFCKRKMLKLAVKYAKYLDCDAVVTGDSLGQVASQTLKNLSVINKDINYLVLRPLIGLDKDEIIKIAKEIGTYNISTEKEIKCPFVPKHPKTIAKWDDIEKIRKKVNIKI
ncbi:tRNA uracil 4-sulfurtransferase ThiI [Methanocaldococcus indicus]|uniref:tRNA uracil 4-sulfurtransferase ThiI n=1 Tax=Methanocaldococcus indicus TaxID=213231 RepID=UPI003C6CF7C2